ncbi:MAG: hypothetical protein JWO56_3277 [Acidobacteria bacterium]|nr:hypothetical protein [Acidobacteriota bacterium]
MIPGRHESKVNPRGETTFRIRINSVIPPRLVPIACIREGDGMINLVVLDYDGTITDIRDGAPEFDRAYVRGLGDVVGGKDLRQEWERAKAAIRAASPEAAWTVIGPAKIAPAAGDPYALASEAAKHFLTESGVLPSAALQGLATGELYTVAYNAAPYAFRPDARTVLGVLTKARSGGQPIRTCFVTNSATDTVKERLVAKLFPGGLGALEVQGGAAKFLIAPPSQPSDLFDKLPESVQVAGLTRPILLRRGSYFDALRRLWEDPAHPATAATTLVVGDVWELDLAMPAALGCQIHLVLRDNTYDYELNAAKAAGAVISANLLPILNRLEA